MEMNILEGVCSVRWRTLKIIPVTLVCVHVHQIAVVPCIGAAPSCIDFGGQRCSQSTSWLFGGAKLESSRL
jgi:hypothetical protein